MTLPIETCGVNLERASQSKSPENYNWGNSPADGQPVHDSKVSISMSPIERYSINRSLLASGAT